MPTVAGVVLIAAFVRHALRVTQPLLDLRLFSRRTPAASAVTMLLFACAFFGSMLLLPLYYQVARGQSALHAGLLLVPQGLGAALTMPIGGRVVDRSGAARIVLPGLVLLLAGMTIFTQVGATTSLWVLGGASFLMGLGMGSTMMPTMSAAYQTLTHAQVARATTSLNIVQRGGGALGTALLSVVLASQLAVNLPGAVGAGQGLAAAQRIPPAARERFAPLVADAFGHAFTWALVLLALAIVPALFLPFRKPEPAEEPAAAPVRGPETAPEPVHV